jgi:hypothetical protein
MYSGVFCEIFSASLFRIGIYYEIKITSTSFAQKFELKSSLGGPFSKLCVTPPFSINVRCQIENQVSDYRLLGASSFKVKQVCWDIRIALTSHSLFHFQYHVPNYVFIIVLSICLFHQFRKPFRDWSCIPREKNDELQPIDGVVKKRPRDLTGTNFCLNS